MPGPKRGAPNAGRPNRSGIDWDDPTARSEYFRSRRAAYAAGEVPDSRFGRGYGEGAYTICVQEDRHYGYEILIGRALYAAIERPRYITLDRYRSGIAIHRCALEWRGALSVDGFKRNTTPKVSIGESMLAEFDLTIGSYRAAVVGDLEIHITHTELRRVLYREP